MNTQRQPNSDVTRPPTTFPNAAPVAPLAAHIPRAILRSHGRLKTVVSSESAAGEASAAHQTEADQLEELILNKALTFKGRIERFKLWPSQADRSAFAHAMDPEEPRVEEHRVIEAHDFFRREIEQGLIGTPDEEGIVPPGTEELRAKELCSTLEHRLVVVAIDLSGHEDSQLIRRAQLE